MPESEKATYPGPIPGYVPNLSGVTLPARALCAYDSCRITEAAGRATLSDSAGVNSMSSTRSPVSLAIPRYAQADRRSLERKSIEISGLLWSQCLNSQFDLTISGKQVLRGHRSPDRLWRSCGCQARRTCFPTRQVQAVCSRLSSDSYRCRRQHVSRRFL